MKIYTLRNRHSCQAYALFHENRASVYKTMLHKFIILLSDWNYSHLTAMRRTTGAYPWRAVWMSEAGMEAAATGHKDY